MNKLTYALLLVIAVSIPFVIADATDDCLSTCRKDPAYNSTTAPCCDCCGSTGTCNGNIIFRTCCAADEDFCGCISSRAFCSGSIYNSTFPTESPFGTCYPKGYGTCSYGASPNRWVVCPTGLTGCVGNSGSSCCNAGETCGTDGFCYAATTTSSESNTESDTNNTPSTTQSEPTSCIDACRANTTSAPYSPQCCDCCDATNCKGNAIFSTCCTSEQDYCGCISSRGFCSGSVYNNAFPTESPFGTCYPKGYGTCTLSSTANVWIVCPAGRVGCIGNNLITSCCSAEETCNTQTGTCQAATQSPSTNTGSGSQATATFGTNQVTGTSQATSGNTNVGLTGTSSEDTTIPLTLPTGPDGETTTGSGRVEGSDDGTTTDANTNTTPGDRQEGQGSDASLAQMGAVLIIAIVAMM